MDAGEDVSVGVDLEEVAVVHVEPESPRGERWVVLELEELLGVTERDEAVLQQPKAQNLTVEEENGVVNEKFNQIPTYETSPIFFIPRTLAICTPPRCSPCRNRRT